MEEERELLKDIAEIVASAKMTRTTNSVDFVLKYK